MRRSLITLACLLATSATAEPVSFKDGWNHQRLSLFSANRYSFGDQLSMTSDGAVSIAWTKLPEAEWSARAAQWSWTVEQSVPATDLRQKGGEDRNLSLYFVFVPEAEAPSLAGKGIRSLLGRDDVRVLQYAWGGNHSRGAVFGSPWGRGGAVVALRQAGTGSHSENVDLAADYARAFGGTPGALVGLAVSGDSDDTDSMIRAAIGGLVLR